MSTQPKPFVFVVMPFAEEFDDMYQLGIKKACENAGAYAERMDEQIFNERILQRVYNQIAKADIVVAEMTGRNANVFYETGYAHALGKNVVLVTKHKDDIPFDLKDFPHIIHEGRITYLLTELERHIRHFIANPRAAMTSAINTIEVQVNDVVVRGEPSIQVEVPAGSNTVPLTIDVHNSAVRELRRVRCQLGLITPNQFRRARIGDVPIHTVRLTAEETLHYLPDFIELLPGGWQKFAIAPAVSEGTVEMNTSAQFSVRVFTETGYFDYPFVVETVRRQFQRANKPA